MRGRDSVSKPVNFELLDTFAFHQPIVQGMSEIKFDPPLALKGPVTVRSLQDAADLVRRYKHARRPGMRDILLRHLERANTENEQRIAADAFRTWAELEGLLAKSPINGPTDR